MIPQQYLNSLNWAPVTSRSHSELTAFSICPAKHFWAHNMRLRPNETNAPIFIGVNVHALLAAYFIAKKEGESHEDALKRVEKKKVKIVNDLTIDILTNLGAMNFVTGKETETILNRLDYSYKLATTWLEKFYPVHSKWEILQVEEKNYVEVNEVRYAFTCDLLIHERGRVFIQDFKCVQKSWDEFYCSNSPQLRLYGTLLEKLGRAVDGYRYLFILFTKNKSKTKMHVEEEQFEIFEKDRSANDRSVLKDYEYQAALVQKAEETKEFPMLIDKARCTWCDFKNLCRGAMGGGSVSNIEFTIGTEFRESDYGY
jgi:hypothetical protein